MIEPRCSLILTEGFSALHDLGPILNQEVGLHGHGFGLELKFELPAEVSCAGLRQWVQNMLVGPLHGSKLHEIIYPGTVEVVLVELVQRCLVGPWGPWLQRASLTETHRNQAQLDETMIAQLRGERSGDANL